MPYFERPAVDRSWRPHRTAPAAAFAQRRPGVPAASSSAVERASRILAAEPKITDGLAPSFSAASLLSERALAPLLALPPTLAPAAQPSPHAEDVALLAAPVPAAAGSTTSVVLTLANDDGSPVTLTFRATDLLSPEGAGISARQVSFVPADVTLAPGAQGTIRIEVAVPPGTPAGSYAALVQSVGPDLVRSVLSIEVTR
jgi:hypothetical protein